MSLLEGALENLCDIARGMFVDVPLASQFLDKIIQLLLGSRQHAIEPVQQKHQVCTFTVLRVPFHL